MDEEDYDLMSDGDRAAAEAELRRRDREEGKLILIWRLDRYLLNPLDLYLSKYEAKFELRILTGRLDGRMRRGLLYDSDEDDDDEPARRRRRLAAERAADGRIIEDDVSR